MREIKFRAWDNLNKKMIYGVSVFNSLAFKNNIHLPTINGERNYCIEQFTGLLDKYKNEIYEGDIIKYTQHHFNTPMIIEKTKEVKWKYDKWGVYETNAGESDIKIIGNIYENPELLAVPTAVL